MDASNADYRPGIGLSSRETTSFVLVEAVDYKRESGIDREQRSAFRDGDSREGVHVKGF